MKLTKFPGWLLALGVFALVGLARPSARAQHSYDDTASARSSAVNSADLKVFDLNGDGKVEDWERDKVSERLFSERDLNGDGVIDKKDAAIAKQMVQKMKEERAAEIKKYDKNGDGKLDAQEDAVRIADQARERAAQKPSAARAALEKSILDQ